MISNIFKTTRALKKVATNERRKEEGGAGGARGEEQKREGKGATGGGKKAGGAKRVIKKLGEKLERVVGRKKEKKEGMKSSSLSSFASSLDIQVDLVKKLEVAFQGPSKLAMDAGCHLLETISKVNDDLATDVNEGILRVTSMEEEGLSSVAEYLSWLVAGLESGKWQREEEGSLNGWAFVVSKILPILAQASQALQSDPSSFDVLLFAAQLQLLDSESSFFLLNTFERTDRTNEEKIELIENAIEDLEVTVRVFYSKESSSAHLLKDSFFLSLPVLNKVEFASHSEPYALERQLMDSYSSIAFSLPKSTVSEQVGEVETGVQLQTLRRTKQRRSVWSSEELVVVESSTTEEEEEETSEEEELVETPSLGREVVEAWWVMGK